ncbi:MAG: ribonuclease III [Candidatus Melainabacteria bacterium]|nr:ribonuclease III [Candidatus Melainabacteria bacterium]
MNLPFETTPQAVSDYAVHLQRRQEIDALLQMLGLPLPGRYDLYDQALVHSSFTYENRLSPLENYERLEFLGDAILKLIVSDYLFERFPDYREGDLTKIRAVIVSDNRLAKFAQQVGLGHYIVFGASEARNGGREKVSNLACAFEAFLGALYLDDHLEAARAWLYELLADEVTEVDMSDTKDNYKAVLQELTQADGFGLPVYRTVGDVGPSHNKTFFVEVLVHHEVIGHGSGKTKKEAQQSAAKMALSVLNQLPSAETVAALEQPEEAGWTSQVSVLEEDAADTLP